MEAVGSASTGGGDSPSTGSSVEGMEEGPEGREMRER